MKPKRKPIQTPLSIPAASVASLLVFHAAGAFAAGDALFLANAFSVSIGTVVAGLIVLMGFACFCGYLGLTCGLMLVKAAPARPVGVIVAGYLAFATIVFSIVAGFQGQDWFNMLRGGLAGISSIGGVWLMVLEAERRQRRLAARDAAREAAREAARAERGQKQD